MPDQPDIIPADKYHEKWPSRPAVYRPTPRSPEYERAETLAEAQAAAEREDLKKRYPRPTASEWAAHLKQVEADAELREAVSRPMSRGAAWAWLIVLAAVAGAAIAVTWMGR